MTSRESILQQITANKPAFVALPEVDSNTVIKYNDLFLQFTTVLETIGGTVSECNDLESLKSAVVRQKEAGIKVVNAIPALGEIDTRLNDLSATGLMDTGVAYINGSLAVAENGSIWVYESQMINRLLPFICQQLVLVIQKENIVATMHHAYQQLDTFKEGFGVFIAGPSKTADIEQSLVIGAHGPVNLKVIVTSKYTSNR